MAYASGRLFVAVVDLCGWGSAIARPNVDSIDPARGRGRLVAINAATGRPIWERRLPSPNFGCATVADDVVFTSTYDGVVYAFATGDKEYALAQADTRQGKRMSRGFRRHVAHREPGSAGLTESHRELVAFALDG